jgi:polar amino acid transport system substrate-binding protein
MLSAVLLLLFIPGNDAQAKPKQDQKHSRIIVGGDYNYPPHEFLNDHGEPDGYNVEMTRAIGRVMGLDVEIVLGPWDELRDKLKRGEIDVIQGILKSTEREKYLDFSAPYAIISQSIFARKGSAKKITLNDLNDHEVIVQKNGFMQEHLRIHAPRCRFIAVDTHVDALRLLASGKHEYAVVAVPLGIYLQKKYELSNIEPVSAPLTNAPYGYGVQKGNSEVLELFSAGLAILINTGVQQKLYAKWLGDGDGSMSGWTLLRRYGPWVLTPLLTIIIGVVIWNSALSRKVAERTRELEERQRQLVQADKLASLGILTSGVAHEINTPNGIILMNLPVITEAWEDTRHILDAYRDEHGDFAFGGLSYQRLRDEVPIMLADMTDSARRIRQIVNDLKAYARLEAPQAACDLDLNEVVRSAVRLADLSIKKATSRAVVNYCSDLPHIRGNPQRLTQVVVNLIVNACQALEHPELGIEITTRYDAASARVVLEVIDEGSGIRPDDMVRLTDPFFTTKRDHGGTGLGLSVSAGIVGEHGGEMIFASKPGHRTTVTVTLPTINENV